MDAEEQFALLEKGILLKGDLMRCDDTGWLKIGDTFSNEVFDLTEGEIEELLALAEEDDAWTRRVKAEFPSGLLPGAEFGWNGDGVLIR